LRKLFAQREFAAYFAARQTSLLAFSIEDVAMSWQIFQLRHNPFDLGLIGLVLFLPQLLLAIPAGMLADRYDRRAICVLSTLTEAAGLCGFVALVLLHVHSLAIYLAAVAFVGTAHSIGIPAQRSLLANIVQAEHFVRAQATSSSASQLITIAGPAIAGALIAGSTMVAFAAAAACYIAAAAAFTRLSPREISHGGVPLFAGALEGIRFIFDRKVVLGAISLDLFAVLFGGAVALLPVYATSILHVGPTGFGALRAAPAVGAAVVAAYIARRPLSRNAGRLLLLTVAGFGAATIVFGVSRNFVVSLVALALTGGFDMVSMVIRTVLVQLRTPDAMRGRVGAVENIFIGASNELGAFESGTVASLIGTQASVVLGGVATIVVILLWSVFFPELRKFDRLVEAAPNEGKA
jgi:MFS family permease